MLLHEIVYTVRFRPVRYHFKERREPDLNSYVYWIIYENETMREVGFTMTENDAKAIILSLDYTAAVLSGDTTAQLEFANALAKLRQ